MLGVPATQPVFGSIFRVCVFALLISWTCCTLADDADGLSDITNGPAGIDTAMSATVFIRGDRSMGAGFVISDDGLVLTNYHVIAGAERLEIRLRSGTILDAGYVYSTPELFAKDLALIRLPEGRYDAVPVGTGPPQTGSDVIVIGHPHGHTWTLTKGYIAGVRRENGRTVVQTSASISPGSSGGPICTESGTAAGVSTYMERRVLNWDDGRITIDPCDVLKFGISIEEIHPYIGHLSEYEM